MKTPTAGPRQAEVERALALRDVMDHAVKVQKEVASKAPGPRRGSRLALLLALCAPLIGLAVWSYVARPEVLWGPPAELPAAERESHLRLSMFFLSQRVQAARAQSGRYPGTLAEIGAASAGVSYRLLGDSVFVLSAAGNGRQLVLRSDASAEEFLGSSLQVIRPGAR